MIYINFKSQVSINVVVLAMQIVHVKHGHLLKLIKSVKLNQVLGLIQAAPLAPMVNLEVLLNVQMYFPVKIMMEMIYTTKKPVIPVFVVIFVIVTQIVNRGLIHLTHIYVILKENPEGTHNVLIVYMVNLWDQDFYL